jgi:hypothetical protein
MNIKFVSTLLLVGSLFGPLDTIAKDTTTDTTSEYVDDATITAKVKAEFAKDKLV